MYRAHPEHARGKAKSSPAEVVVVTATEVDIEAVPEPVLVFESQPSAPEAPPLTLLSSPAVSHLDAAISGLEREVEMDKLDLARLEALQRDLARKQELLAGLLKERGKFVGTPTE